jgi:hypothetical protein
MSTPPDSFSESFDSIEIDRSRAPSPEAIERALAHCAPRETQPGFYLRDDAGGRFIIDRNTGVIMLKDESLLERERNSVHTATLCVVEPSGAAHDLDIKLRLTGPVPHVVGAEDLFENSATAPPRIAWSRYAAVAGLYAPPPLNSEGAPYGSLLATALPAVATGFAGLILIETIPEPAPKSAHWSL